MRSSSPNCVKTAQGTPFALRVRVHDMTSFEGLPAALRGEHPPAVLMGDLTLVRSLGMAKTPSIVVTTDRSDITIRSRYVGGYCVVDGFDARPSIGDRTAAKLIALGRRMRPHFAEKLPLFYGTDSQLAFLHAYRQPLSEWYSFLLNDDALGRALWDKDQFYELASRTQVPIPRTARADDSDAVSSLRSPVLIKPRAKVAWKHLQRELFDGTGKARVFESVADLLKHPEASQHKADLLVQEYIPGSVADLYSFHGFADQSGTLLGHFSGRKIRTFPHVAGESSFIELSSDDAIAKLGKEVVRKLGVRGVFKIDLIKDPRDGALYVLEVNARFNLWNYLGAVHGVNLPKIAYDFLVSGKRIPHQGGYRPRFRWLNFYRDWHGYRERRTDGTLPFARWATSIATSRTIYEAFAWSDPKPFAWWLADHLRKKVV